MEEQTVNYILGNYSNLMTEKENRVEVHYFAVSQIGYTPPKLLKRFYANRQLISSDPEVLVLLKDGYPKFRENTATRILQEHKETISFNHCPKCHLLMASVKTRQCRECGNDWHEGVVGRFRILSAFQITGRYFFVAGILKRGTATVGDYLDLMMLGISKKVQIKAVEFALRKEGTEDIALGLDELSDSEKQLLKTKEWTNSNLAIYDKHEIKL